jgi:hypothetical protein
MNFMNSKKFNLSHPSEDQHWERMTQKLIEFKNIHGNSLPPLFTAKNTELREWIEIIIDRKTKIDRGTKRKLQKIGFYPRGDYEFVWNFHYLKLCKHIEKYGPSNLSSDFKNAPSLHNWVQNQRQKRNSLSDDKIKKLDKLGFVWTYRNDQWETYLLKLINFKEMHGHCRVSKNSTGDPKFEKWILGLRTTKDQMHPDRKKQLDQLGFVWSPHDLLWDKNFLELKKFKEIHGHLNVPFDGFLNKWILRQRRQKKKMDVSKIEKLDQLGFIWRPVDVKWEEKYQALLAFKAKFGHFKAHKEDNSNLSQWITIQRKNCLKLDPEKRKKLNNIGFEWDPTDATWERHFQSLLEFNKIHGHCNVTIDIDQKLYSWVVAVKSKKAKLPIGRIIELENIGFSWDCYEKRWEENFKKLVAFKNIHGHLNVPIKYKEDRYLGSWVHSLRVKDIKMSKERRDRLMSIGFYEPISDEATKVA